MRLNSLQAEEKAGVPLAPLIDCVFILLIFFLVTSMLQKPHKEVRIDVPHSGAGEEETKEPEPLVIVLTSALPGALLAEQREMARLARKDAPVEEQRFEPYVLIGEEALDKDLLDRRLRQVAQAAPNRRIRLDIQGDIPWRHVVPIIDFCRFHGLVRLDVRTD